jgi:hypothetical protein
MEEGPEFGLVDAVGDGLFKIGRLDAAGAAEEYAGCAGIGVEGFAAARAEDCGLGRKAAPAGGTDGQERETRKRKAADAAIGGEEDGREAVEEAREGTSEHANHGAPCREVGWRNFGRRQGKALTEDTPRFGGPAHPALTGCSIRGKVSAGNREGRGRQTQVP